MFVGESFTEDKNDDLKWIQHDLWFKENGAWMEASGFSMGSCMYIFWCARNAFLSSTEENPLFFPEREKLAFIEHFDHRVLQYAHHKIAAFYRWINRNVQKPAFIGEVSYNDWVRRKRDAERRNSPFNEDYPYHIYLLDTWKLYLRHEIAHITFGNISLSEFIVKAVLFQNTDHGYAAENYIDDFLRLRYGAEFDHVLKIHSQKSENQSNELRGYIYIMISPALHHDFLKIGKTTRTSEKRANELSIGTGVPLRFYVVFDTLVTDCHSVEKIVHQRLSKFRSSSNREFFEIPLKEAISVINEVSKDYLVDYAFQSDSPTNNMAERQ